MDFGDIAKGVENAAPKLESLAKDSMDWVKHSDARIKAHEKHFSNLEDLRNEVSDAEKAYYNTDDSGENWDLARSDYANELKKMLKNLQPPKLIKNDINEEIDYIKEAIPGESYARFDMHNLLNDYHNKIAKLHPEDKKLFDYLVDNVNDARFNGYQDNLHYASALMPHLKKLDTTQKDTFLKLLPEWTGSLDDLEVTARLL